MRIVSGSFFAELKRRNVFRAAAFYAASAWLLVQIATQVFPFFHIAEWVVRWIVIAALIGFPFVMAFSWFYEWTPKGLQRESDVAPDESVARDTGKKLDRAIIAVLGVAVVLLLADKLVLHKNANDSIGKSIAVLPLLNESGDPKDEYFSDGLSEELIAKITQINDIKVIGRNSSFQFRNTKDDSANVGRKLDVATLLEGTVRKQDDRVHIVIGLIKATDGSSLWSRTYDRELKDIFAVQSDIAQSVAGALKVKLLGGTTENSDKPPSGNLDAFSAYLQGNFYFARHAEDDERKAIDHYDEAIRLDSRYALAYAALSYTYTDLAATFLGGVDMQHAYAKARAAAAAAVSLDPNLPLAHLARGYYLAVADFDWDGAEAENRRALQLAPNDGGAKFLLGGALAILGQMDEAITLTRQALATNPLNARWHSRLASFLSGLGRLDQAEQAIRKAIELQPTAASYHTQLANIEIQRGDAVAALRAAQQEPPGGWQDTALAMAQQISGDSVAADAALQVLIDKDASASTLQIADVYALRKQSDKAFEWLDRAFANSDPGITTLLYDPFLLTLKSDPRFAAFCKKVGLPLPAGVKPMPAATSASATTKASASASTLEPAT